MPPPRGAELPLNVLSVTVRVPALLMPPPPSLPTAAVLALNVQLVTVSPPALKTPAPPPPVAVPMCAELPLKVQAVSVRVPEARLATPPPETAELPVTVQAVRERVPALETPPPVVAALPPVILRPEMAAVAALATVKTWKGPTPPPGAPLRVSRPAPGPVTVVAPLVRASGPWVSEMVGGGVVPTSAGEKVMTVGLDAGAAAALAR